MSGMHDSAVDALKNLLWELPAEFKENPDDVEARPAFCVLKKSNVANVHRALWELQEYFGITEE